MNKKIYLISAIILSLLIFQTGFAFASRVTLFTTEYEASNYCPSDTVVWVNTKTGVFHFKGQRWYENTKQGAYVCKKDAIKSHYRPTKNRQ